jgi:precorrin-6A/cobalt-precorrin-6A reductase
MPSERILILGGTRDARELAAALLARGFHVITSLAGVTADPVLPPGEVRRGGFGGAAGLANYLKSEGIAAVADATHPFAALMSANADAACRATGLPLLRLERPAWRAGPGDRWTSVTSAAEAAAVLPAHARVLLTIGRKEIAPFLVRQEVSGIARMIEPPQLEFPPPWTLLLERPPFTIEAERRLISDHAITWLVTKNAGGGTTEAKLVAAREAGIPVVMIERPAKPEVPSLASAHEFSAEIERLLSP